MTTQPESETEKKSDVDWEWGAAVNGLRARLQGLFPGIGTDVFVYFQDTGYRSVTCTVHWESAGHKCHQIQSAGHDLRGLLRDIHRQLDEGWKVPGLEIKASAAEQVEQAVEAGRVVGSC